MAKKKNVLSKIREYIPLNIGTFIFGALFFYMLVSVIMYLTADHIQSYQVTAGPLSRNQIYTALAIREEQVTKASASGYITYYARENSRVAENGVVYTQGEQQTEAAVEELTEEDYSRIRASMAGFASSFDSDNFQNAYTYKYELEGTILQYSGLKSANGTVPTMIGNQSVHTATVDGIIQYTVDGYEDVTIDTLDPNLFNRKNYKTKNLQSTKKVAAGEPIYKQITGETWYLMIPLTDAQAVQLSGRERVQIKFLKDGNTQMANMSIILDDNDNFYCKLELSNGMIRYAADRFLDIELVTNTKSGLKIPLSSIVNKDFYIIPKEYVTHDEKNGTAGFNREIIRENEKDNTSEFVKATIYQEDDTYYYVDKETFRDGDVIIKPNSQSTCVVEETRPLEGVFCINKGYAVFRKVEIIDKNEEYCIVKTGTSYGIAQFDHIVRDSETVQEDDILYK